MALTDSAHSQPQTPSSLLGHAPATDSSLLPKDDDRIFHLEQAVAALQAEKIETQTRTNSLLSIITQLTQAVSRLEKQNVPPPADSIRARTVRPAVPPEFDGDRAKGIAFLNACETYVRLCPSEFPDEQAKILWAMSYMKAGRAQRWTARIFRWSSRPENSDSTRFFDWQDFLEEFEKEFTPAHADAVAINRLESEAYFQKCRSLDDYIDEFQDLIADAGYTDQKTIVVKFRRGLDMHIQDAAATMASGRPLDTSPEQWYHMARIIDQNRASNDAFQSAYRHEDPSECVSSGPSSVQSALIPVVRVVPPQFNSHAISTPELQAYIKTRL